MTLEEKASEYAQMSDMTKDRREVEIVFNAYIDGYLQSQGENSKITKRLLCKMCQENRPSNCSGTCGFMERNFIY
jgi:rhamnogalacturonyl hydrolase YesR